MDDEFGVDEFGLDEDGRLHLFGPDDAAGGEPAGSPWNDEVDAGWNPGDQLDAWEDDDGGAEAWLRSLPPGLRAEVLARPPAVALADGAAAVRGGFTGGGYCDTMLPGSMLAGMLAEATTDGFAELSDDELAGVLRAWQRQVSGCQSELVRIVAEIGRRRAGQSRRPGWSRIAEHVSDELAAELTLTGRSAARQLELAAGLERLPEVHGALLSGFIDWPRACVFADELAVLGDVTAAGIAARLADRAAGWTTGQLRAALARAVLAADPGAADRRRTAARKETRVELWREGSGNAALAGRELRTASAIRLDRKLDSDADWLAACGVPGSKGELRVLAYTTLLAGRDLASIPGDPASWPHADDDTAPAGGAATGGLAERTSATPEPAAGSIHLTMPLSALAGGSSPGEVTGFGPVDAGTSRELAGLLAADPATRWCLTVTSPAGQAAAHACARRGPAPAEPAIRWAAGLRDKLIVLESGACRHARQSAGYVPPPRLRHLVTIRQRRCAFPGCRRPARQCDLDHTIPHHHGGRTCECNLAPLCRRHHKAKQAPGWHLEQREPGVMTWRLPSSRTYQTTGDPYLE